MNLKPIRGKPEKKTLKGISHRSLYELPLVTIRDEQGKDCVLSRVGDNPWNLSPFIRVSNTKESIKKPDLRQRFPEQWQESVRALLYCYFVHGQPGNLPPGAGTLYYMIHNLSYFVKFLEKRGVRSFKDVKPLLAMEYVEQEKKRKLKPGTLTNRFSAVEMVYNLRNRVEDALPQHPWSESSASILSGEYGHGGPRYAKTEIIPEDIVIRIFQTAQGVLAQAHELLEVRDRLTKNKTYEEKVDYLKKQGFSRLREFDKKLLDIREAAYIVLGLLTGCRNHELADLQTNAVYSSEHNGEVFWWLRSSSWKTHAGPAVEWMCPDYCVDVTGILERYSQPLRKEVLREIEALRKNLSSMDENFPEYVDCLTEIRNLHRLHKNRLFLARTPSTNRVRVLVGESWSAKLTEFCFRHGIDWKLKPHQLRRTFAVNAARNAACDIRYLREQLKHYRSFDMTALYAFNKKQDSELYDMILDEMDGYNVDIVEHWLKEESLLAGGAGKAILKTRKTKDVATLRDHFALLRQTAQNVCIRATGHSFCLGERCRCDGHGLYDALDCPSCRGSVIDKTWIPVWKGFYLQQLELKKKSDIGKVGQAKVRRALKIIRGVLEDLGVDVDQLQRQLT